MADGGWQLWRHLEGFWDELEEQGWELGPVKRANLPPILAESGPYRLAFRCWDSELRRRLFELREIHEGDEHTVVFVWGIPSPDEAADLLSWSGVPASEVRGDAGGPSEGMPIVFASNP